MTQPLTAVLPQFSEHLDELGRRLVDDLTDDYFARLNTLESDIDSLSVEAEEVRLCPSPSYGGCTMFQPIVHHPRIRTPEPQRETY